MARKDPGRDAFAAMLADYKAYGRLREEPYPGEVTSRDVKIGIAKSFLLFALIAVGAIVAAIAHW